MDRSKMNEEEFNDMQEEQRAAQGIVLSSVEPEEVELTEDEENVLSTNNSYEEYLEKCEEYEVEPIMTEEEFLTKQIYMVESNLLWMTDYTYEDYKEGCEKIRKSVDLPETFFEQKRISNKMMI